MEIGILIIVVPLIVYLISAFTIPKGYIRHPDDFFIAYRKIGTTPFSNSSIAYAFQVATIYLFLLWGASYTLLVPFLNAIWWGFGIIFFSLFLYKIKDFIGSDLTLHGFLGVKYTPSIRILTSVLTIIGLLGVAIAEIFWGSKVLLAIIDDRNLIYLIMFLVAFYVLLYISHGGHLSSVRTDQLQLIFSYLGIFGLMIYLLYILTIVNPSFNNALSMSIIFLIIYIPLVFIIRRGKFVSSSTSDNSYINKLLKRAANIGINISLILFLGMAIFNFKGINLNVSFENIFNLSGFGYSGLISLILLPFFWQFVDMTNWQRILAVSNATRNESGHLKSIKKGLLVYGIESPFTWIIFIIVGILIASTKPEIVSTGDIFINLPKQFINSSYIIERILGYTFIVSVMAIMLSTVDSVIIASMFTFVYDTWSKTRKIIDEKDQNKIKQEVKVIITTGRLFGLIVPVLGILLFVLFDVSIKRGEHFIGMLFAFYTAQLSFLPAVLGAILFKNLPNNRNVTYSIVIGATAGILLGLYSTFIDQKYQWYPVIVTLILSSLVYLAGYVSGGKSHGKSA